MAHTISQHGFGRLTANAPNRLHTYAREMEILEILDSVFAVARRIARAQLDEAGHEASLETGDDAPQAPPGDPPDHARGD
jgi:hypothetical protein